MKRGRLEPINDKSIKGVNSVTSKVKNKFGKWLMVAGIAMATISAPRCATTSRCSPPISCVHSTSQVEAKTSDDDDEVNEHKKVLALVCGISIPILATPGAIGGGTLYHEGAYAKGTAALLVGGLAVSVIPCMVIGIIMRNQSGGGPNYSPPPFPFPW